MRLLVTDLDNTLYDWVTFYSHAVSSMVRCAAQLLETSESQILAELKVVHQHYGNSETPFAILEIQSAQQRFPTATRIEMMRHLDAALHAFNSARKRELKLYPGVEETLSKLHADGVRIVGHTEAIAINAYYRLLKLGILPLFSRLYALESRHLGHPDNSRREQLHWPEHFVFHLPDKDRKPNPMILRDICAREGVLPKDTIYVGDSLTRDIAMAVEANVTGVWARYGRNFEASDWETLVKITHWTPADVAAEEAIRERYKFIKPNFIIESFASLLDIWDRIADGPTNRSL